MKQTNAKRGAPYGNTNALKHGMRDAKARKEASEREIFYRWCRKTLKQIRG